MKTTILLSLISTALVALSQPAWAGGGGGGGFHGGGFGGGFHGGGSAAVSAGVALVLAVFVAALCLPNPLQAESGVAVAALALAVPV